MITLNPFTLVLLIITAKHYKTFYIFSFTAKNDQP